MSPALAQIFCFSPFWKHQHRPWRRYSLPFRFRQSRYRAPSQLLCASSPTLSRFLSLPLPFPFPFPFPSVAPRMRAWRMQPDKATATIFVFPRLFSPSFRAISPFPIRPLRSTIQEKTKESGVCSWRVFARERALIANDCFRRVPPFREKVVTGRGSRNPSA